jgi:hypothetical protein
MGRIASQFMYFFIGQQSKVLTSDNSGLNAAFITHYSLLMGMTFFLSATGDETIMTLEV